MFEFIEAANCIAVAPDYRLAPKYKFPDDLNDCYDTLKWLADTEKNKLPVNPDKIAVAGLSAGGGLTAALTLKARDNKGPKICFQMPLYPMLDCRNDSPSLRQMNSDSRAWCRVLNTVAWEMYLGKDYDPLHTSEYASPALANDLTNLPPAYIMVGQLDPFRDEVINYAQRMLEAGVPVEFHVIRGGTHGFEAIFADKEISKRVRKEYTKALAEALK